MHPRRFNMPTISTFGGIKVMMFYNDHAPPHVHIDTGGDVQFVVNVLSPSIPRKTLNRTGRKILLTWILANQEALLVNWGRAGAGQPLIKIPGPTRRR